MALVRIPAYYSYVAAHVASQSKSKPKTMTEFWKLPSDKKKREIEGYAISKEEIADIFKRHNIRQ